MTWNWQRPDWPNFSWNVALLRKAEEHFLIGTGVFVGTVKHLGVTDREQLTVEAISAEGLSAENYMRITGASPATATRDLADLVAKEALIRTGERRHARYSVGVPLKSIDPVRLDARGDFT